MTTLAIVCIALGVIVAPERGADVDAPMSAAERADRRTAFLDDLWAPVAAQYPEAIRPRVQIGRTVDDRGRRAAIASCLRDAGMVASVDTGRLEYSNGTGQSQIDLAVAVYSCSATFPTIQVVTADLDRDQLGALWDYYTATLRPCLAASGFRTWVPPSRADFLAPDGHHTWNPYLPLRGVRLDPDELDPLEAGCPAVPAWLDLRR